MSQIPPGLQATIDQTDAALRQLVELARQHRATPCPIPVCNGRDVYDKLLQTGTDDLVGLLLVAIAQLADTPRPPHQHGAASEPGEDAIVRVDTPNGPGYFVRDDTLDQPDNDGDHWWPLVYAAAPLTWQQVSADGPPVVLAPSTPDTEEGPTP